MTNTSTRLNTAPCDYCNDEPIATDYGACASCHDHFEADTLYQGPSLRVNGREVKTGSREYDFYLAQV